MRKMKKLLAISLSVAMICGIFVTLVPNTTEAAMPTTEYFEETFSTDGSFDETWSADSTDNLSKWAECVTNGKLCIPGTNSTALYLLADDDVLMETADYTVSCKIQFADGELSNDTNISITSRATAVNTTGYEFQLTVKKDGSALVGLRDRQERKYFIQNKSLENFDHTTENELKIKTAGNLVTCYINENLIFSCDISTTYKDGSDVTNIYSVGTTAIRMATTEIGVDVSFDDFKVYHIEDYKFCDDFNGYNGEATNAQKKQALEANDWYIASNPNAEYINGNSYVIPADSAASPIVLQTENAKGALGWNDYSVEADITIGEGELASAVNACVTGRHTVAGGTDGYEIRLHEDIDGTQKLQIYGRNAGSEIRSCPFPFERGKTYNLKAVFQKNEIHAYVDGVLYLTATSDAYPIGYAGIRKIGASCGVDVTFDNFVVYDYDVTPATFVDDFESYEPTLDESVNNWDYRFLQANGWGAGDNSIGTLRTYAGYADNGVFMIPAGKDAVNMIVDDYHSLRNCTLQWNLKFDENTEVTANATNTYVTCRQTSDNEGYGLLIGTNKTKITYIRIVSNGKKLADAGVADANGNYSNITLSTSNRIDFGTTVTARLVLNERVITGYIVGQEDTTTVTYTIPDTEEIVSGYVAIHTGNTSLDVTFDDFTLYDNDNPYVKEIVGDINADTSVDATDTTVLKDSLLSGTLENTALDVNKNNATNILDYVRMKRLVYSLEH